MTGTDSGAEASATVRVERAENGVRVLRMANPARRNAIDGRSRAELATAVAKIAADAEARVLVVTADGPSFCAGADLVDLFGEASSQAIDQIRNDVMRVYDSFLKILDLPIPTIAAVKGAAIGAGLNLALCCDVRLAAPDVTFGAVFSRIGLHPGGGCTYFLTRILGAQGALRILLDGDSLNAESSLRAGLVSEIVDDPEMAALALAARWAQLDPDLARAIKRSVRLAETAGFAATVEHEAWAQAASAKRPEVQAVVEQRRRPRDRRA
ncbi:MAG: enoyl-CoA hydratase [Chloroflexota bacterium]